MQKTIRINENQLFYLAQKARQDGRSTLSGFLYKKSSDTGKWQQRYFVLYENLLFYYDGEKSDRPSGVALLEGCYCEKMLNKTNQNQGYCFAIYYKKEGQRQYDLKTDTEVECNSWVEGIRQASFSRIQEQKEELEQKHFHLLQILESERQAKWHYVQQTEELAAEVKKLKAELRELKECRLERKNSSQSLEESEELRKIKKVQSFFRGWLCRRRWKQIVDEYIRSEHAESMRKRNNIVFGLVECEEEYVQQLTTMISCYLRPFKMAASSKKPIITHEDVNSIFLNAETLLFLHQIFLQGLHSKIENWPTLQLGDLFDMLLPMLGIYQEYVRNHHYSLQVLAEYKQKAEFNQLLKRYEEKPACEGRSLESFLTYPMHQIPRYIITLHELLAHTPHDHVDREKLEYAKSKLEELSNIMHDEVSETENIRKNLAIERMIVEGCDILLDVNQIFVRQGSLIQVINEKPKGPRSRLGSFGGSSKERKEIVRQVFLFTNNLLLTTRASNGRLHLAKNFGKINLVDCTLIEDTQTELFNMDQDNTTAENGLCTNQYLTVDSSLRNERNIDYNGVDFRILVESKEQPSFTITLVASSIQEKAAWCSDISQCIEQLHYSDLLNSSLAETSSVSMPQSIRSDPKLYRDDVDIKFSRRLNSCKVPQIRHASLDRLMDRLTDLRFLSIDFLNTFLLTYKVFTTGITIVNCLRRVLNNPESGNLDPRPSFSSFNSLESEGVFNLSVAAAAAAGVGVGGPGGGSAGSSSHLLIKQEKTRRISTGMMKREVTGTHSDEEPDAGGGRSGIMISGSGTGNIAVAGSGGTGGVGSVGQRSGSSCLEPPNPMVGYRHRSSENIHHHHHHHSHQQQIQPQPLHHHSPHLQQIGAISPTSPGSYHHPHYIQQQQQRSMSSGTTHRTGSLDCPIVRPVKLLPTAPSTTRSTSPVSLSALSMGSGLSNEIGGTGKANTDISGVIMPSTVSASRVGAEVSGAESGTDGVSNGTEVVSLTGSPGGGMNVPNLCTTTVKEESEPPSESTPTQLTGSSSSRPDTELPGPVLAPESSDEPYVISPTIPTVVTIASTVTTPNQSTVEVKVEQHNISSDDVEKKDTTRSSVKQISFGSNSRLKIDINPTAPGFGPCPSPSNSENRIGGLLAPPSSPNMSAAHEDTGIAGGSSWSLNSLMLGFNRLAPIASCEILSEDRSYSEDDDDDDDLNGSFQSSRAVHRDLGEPGSGGFRELSVIEQRQQQNLYSSSSMPEKSLDLHSKSLPTCSAVETSGIMGKLSEYFKHSQKTSQAPSSPASTTTKVQSPASDIHSSEVIKQPIRSSEPIAVVSPQLDASSTKPTLAAGVKPIKYKVSPMVIPETNLLDHTVITGPATSPSLPHRNLLSSTGSGVGPSPPSGITPTGTVTSAPIAAPPPTALIGSGGGAGGVSKRPPVLSGRTSSMPSPPPISAAISATTGIAQSPVTDSSCQPLATGTSSTAALQQQQNYSSLPATAADAATLSNISSGSATIHHRHSSPKLIETPNRTRSSVVSWSGSVATPKHKRPSAISCPDHDLMTSPASARPSVQLATVGDTSPPIRARAGAVVTSSRRSKRRSSNTAAAQAFAAATAGSLLGASIVSCGASAAATGGGGGSGGGGGGSGISGAVGRNLAGRHFSSTNPSYTDVKAVVLQSKRMSVIYTAATMRVLNVVRHWITKFPEDFDSDHDLKTEMKYLLEDLVCNQNLIPNEHKVAGHLLRQLMDDQLVRNRIDLEVILSPVHLPSRDSFDTLSALDIAEQLTFLDHQIFRSIRSSELLNQGWMKPDKGEKAPHVLLVSTRFNEVSRLVVSEIVTRTEIVDRVSCIEKWAAIADICRCIHNYNGVLQICAAFVNSSVYRLKRTWEKVPKQTRVTIEKLQNLVSSDGRFKNMREALHRCDPPCIPYLGMYLTDLSFIEEGALNVSDNRLINFCKMRMIAHVIREIQQYQQTPYRIERSVRVTDYLLDCTRLLEEEKTYQASLRIEPRQSISRQGQPIQS